MGWMGKDIELGAQIRMEARIELILSMEKRKNCSEERVVSNWGRWVQKNFKEDTRIAFISKDNP